MDVDITDSVTAIGAVSLKISSRLILMSVIAVLGKDVEEIVVVMEM